MEVKSSGDAVLVIDRAEEEEGEKVIVKVVEGGWTSVLPDWAVVSVRSARRCACVSCEETEGEVIEEEVGGGGERKTGSIGRCVSRRETEGPKEDADEVEEGRKVTV